MLSVKEMIQGYYIHCYEGVLQGMYRIIIEGLQRHDFGATGVFHGCYRSVTGVLRGYCMAVTGILQVY